MPIVKGNGSIRTENDLEEIKSFMKDSIEECRAYIVKTLGAEENGPEDNAYFKVINEEYSRFEKEFIKALEEKHNSEEEVSVYDYLLQQVLRSSEEMKPVMLETVKQFHPELSEEQAKEKAGFLAGFNGIKYRPDSLRVRINDPITVKTISQEELEAAHKRNEVRERSEQRKAKGIKEHDIRTDMHTAVADFYDLVDGVKSAWWNSSEYNDFSKSVETLKKKTEKFHKATVAGSEDLDACKAEFLDAVTAVKATAAKYKKYKMSQRKNDVNKLNDDDRIKMALIDAALHKEFPIVIDIVTPKLKSNDKGMSM